MHELVDMTPEVYEDGEARVKYEAEYLEEKRLEFEAYMEEKNE